MKITLKVIVLIAAGALLGALVARYWTPLRQKVTVDDANLTKPVSYA